MPYLFLAHIGPAQDFIAGARSSRDLWFGSWLLSELSKAAALALCEHPNSLIFPAPLNPTDLQPRSNVANKVLAVINDDPAQVGKAVRKAVQARLKDIRTAAFNNVNGDYNKDVAHQQVADLVEFYWAAAPYDSDKYAAARTTVEALMAARKTTRDFAPVAWGSSAPKSSLDGQRESVIPEAAYKLSPPELFKQYKVRPGERLDGVGLLKRHSRELDARFFSTSHVAALPLLARLTSAATDAKKAYFDALEELGADNLRSEYGPNGGAFGHLLFEERLAEFFEEGAKSADARKKLAAARDLLKDFLDQQLGQQKPKPYYALLRADGDRMGNAINQIEIVDRHRDLSQELARFAGKAREIVEAHEGSLVYAGGDDVLAFVPLHRVLECAAALAADFRDRMQRFDTDLPDVHPTLSVGIAVSHYIEPMGDALELAAKAEHAAKRTRNALAVTVSKRSGADRTVSGTWGGLDQRLALFTALHRADAVPDGAAYELQTLARQLAVESSHPDYKTLSEALAAEAMRILERKQIAAGTLAKLKQLINTQDGSVKHLADELIVARLFADAKNLAREGLSIAQPEREPAA